MNEACQALRNLSTTTGVREKLMETGALLEIVEKRFTDSDPISQEFILETISACCSKQEYRDRLIDNIDSLKILFKQIKSISTRITYQTLKIAKKLSQDKKSLEILHEDLQLSQCLIYAFRWIECKFQAPTTVMVNPAQPKELTKQVERPKIDIKYKIFRQIAETFMNILQHYEVHKRLITLNHNKGLNQGAGGEANSAENEMIDTIVSLGKLTSDPKTMQYAATSLAHITEVLNCNHSVASDDAIDFMIDNLQDAKNIEHHKQGCRYLANLSFYHDFRERLI